MTHKSGFIAALIFILLIAPLAASAHAPTADQTRTVQVSTDFKLPGLDGPVTIYYDEMHIPHIVATTTHDLVMAQGFVHAADRWWQMELFRHEGAGRTTEIIGSAVLASDIRIRTLGIPRNAQNDLDHASPEALTLLNAYADGVNAWLEGKTPGEVAVEYSVMNMLREALGAAPVTNIVPWTPFNSATWLHVMADGLNGNMDHEVLMLDLLAHNADLDLLIPDYDYASMPVILEPGRTTATPSAANITSRAESRSVSSLFSSLESIRNQRNLGLGSNNWVVNGTHTTTGLPLLANDPHLEIMMPSIWYEIGLHCAEITPECPYNVSGFSFAGSPLVVLGHNQQIAWGATNVGTDVQDLYLLELNPGNPLQYRYEGAWLDMEVITETLYPIDSDSVTFDIYMTRFGPVVTDILGTEQPVALRWAAVDANRNFEALMQLNKAASWDEFQQAIAIFDLPAQNFVYADRDGNIGYIASGRIPIRVDGHDGTQPVDGTSGAYEWLGYVEPLDNPRLFNPDIGFIVTANNAVVKPEDYPHVISTIYAYGQRAQRIEELLLATEQHTPESFAAIQFDNFNHGAARAVPILAGLDCGDNLLNEAAAWLAAWDYQNDADSPQAALFNAFWRAFVPLVFDEFPVFDETFNLARLEPMWDSPDHPLWQHRTLGSDPARLMAIALERGLDALERDYGADWSAWRWGDLHVARFRAAPLGQLPEGLDPRLDQLLPMLNATFNRETPASGGPAIVNATSWTIESGTFEVNSVPSMRMILDLSDWDNGQLVHTTGQSGDPSSDHYDDMIALWAVGDYHAHHFTAEAFQAVAVETWILSPVE